MKRLFNIILLAMMFAVIVNAVGMSTSTVHAAEDPGLPAAQLINADGTLNLGSGYSGLLDIDGYDVRLDPLHGPVLSPLMMSNAWNALASGLNAIPYAIVINGTDVYVGGQFTDAGGDVNADRIAKWDGSSWSALGSGIGNGQVNTLAFNGSALYVGGTFLDAGGNSSADYVAQWDGSTWSILGNGVNASVSVISVTGLDVYLAGSFTNAGADPNADYIAKLDGSTWGSLGATPLNGPINSIFVAGATVYAGGDFLNAGGDANADYIAQWDGSSWSALGSGLNGSVTSVTLFDGNLYAGGLFNDAGGDANADKIAKWDGSSWSALGSGLNSYVNKIQVSGSDLYVGGNFLNAGGDANADYIARWNGSTWSALGASALNGAVATIAVNGLDLYVGGNFTDAGGNTNADRISRFEFDTSAPTVTSFTALSPSPSVDIPITAFTASDDAAVAAYLVNESDTPPASDDAGWKTSAPAAYSVGSDGGYTLYPWVKDTSGNVSALYGSPLTVSVDTTPPTIYTNAWNPLGGGLSNTAYDLALSGTDVVAVGSFLNAGGYSNGDRAAKWNGTSWSPMGSGLNGQTNAVAVDGSFIYAGGDFYNAGGDVYANQFARWNGSTWTAWGDGVGGTVNDLAVNGSNLYAAGGFVDAGLGTTADFVAQLSGGTWQPLGATPLTSTALAVALDGSDVYFGGSFANAGGNADADFIAKWNGSSWSALGSGLSSTVRTIAVNDGQLYAGGDFSDAGGNASADRIARWNGSSWSALGSGLNGTVYTIATSGTDIYAGGNFTDAGGNANADYIAKWDGTSWSALGNTPLNGTVYAIAVDGLKVYASGLFTDAGGNLNADRIAMFVLDNTAPTVTSFTMPSSSTSFDVPITEFTGSDDMAVTGYIITATSTPPLAGDLGWTSSAPTSLSTGGDGTFTFYPWVKDASGNVSAVYAGGPVNVTVDTSPPSIGVFSVPSSSTSLNIPISTFTATDAVGVTGYLITESATQPSAGAAGWSASAPTTFTVASQGTYTLYPWAKDAGGHVSLVYHTPRTVSVDTSAPTVTAFTVPATSNNLSISINSFTASDNFSVTGYLITESSTPPSAGAGGWSASAPMSFTVASQGSHTLYPWVKDAVGNVSAAFGSPRAVSVDTASPTVTAFSAPSSSNSLTVSINTFTASDNIAVTGYLITESSTPPSAGAGGWSASAPTSYSVGNPGSYTLYPWAKDAVGRVSAVYGSPASVIVEAPSDTTAPVVDSFSVPSSSASLNISITNFAASDDISVTGYLITESATPPSSGDPNWTASAPTSYSVGSDGSYTLYPWVKDAAGNVSAVYGSPANVDVDTSSTVTNANDSGVGSLRAILTSAAPGDTVSFDPSLSGGVIYLSSTLTLSKNVTIDGSMLAPKITISGDSNNDGTGNLRVFYVDSGVTAVLKNLIVTKGVGEEGGGLVNYGTLTIVNSAFSDNTALEYGGAISNNYQLTILESTFSGNFSHDAGALVNNNTLAISDSTFSSNSADGSSGAGGAIYNAGPATITNSTLAGNSAAVGGGIITTQPLTITNGTLSGNSAIIAGGLDIEGYTTNLNNTIIANSTGGDCVNNSTIGTNMNNLVEDGSCSPSISVDPGLGPLQDNGGPTPTMAIDASSPAFNAAISGGCPLTDQRGILRPQGSYCDIGAYEYQDLTPPAVSSITRANLDPTNTANINFTVTFSEPVTGVDATDFTLTTTDLTGTSIATVSGSGTTYTVTVNTGSGDGTIRLDVVDDDSILDALNNPLGGPGNDNDAFIIGEGYSIIKSAVKPSIPALLSPATGVLTTSLQPLLDWKDSSPAAHHYQIQIATNSNFSALEVDDANVSSSDFTPSVPLIPGKLYYWRVRALNVVRVSSGWSTVRSFKTPLAQTVLVSPTDTESLLIDRPTFDWDVVPGATQYTLQASALNNFSTLLVNVTLSTTEYSMTRDLPQNKTIYWRVRAKTSAVTGSWSLKWSFKTGNPPSVPVLVVPANNALIKDYTPVLNWNNSTNPAGTTFKHYELQVDDHNDFSSLEIVTTSTVSEFTPGSALASNTKYYWRVRAVNTNDHVSGWSPVWSFRTIIPAPGSLTMIPTDIPLQPSFDWEDATGPETISGYTLQVSTSASFATLLVNSTMMPSSYTLSKILPSGRTIYCRVRVNGANGPSAWSVMQFVAP